jgi:hypothetical protein
MLPNGRALWLDMSPAPISAPEVDRLAVSISQANAGRTRALGSNIEATRRLRWAIKRDVAKLSRMALRQDRKLRRQLSASAEELGRRIDTRLMDVGRRAKAVHDKQLALIQSHGRRMVFERLTLVSGLPLMATYGRSGDPLAGDNLAISLALFVWLLGPDLIDFLVGKSSAGPGGIRGADVWSYVAPLANLLAGWWLLNGYQHERFVTGTTDLRDFALFSELTSGGGQLDLYLARIDLSPRIAPEHLADFQRFTDVPALATIQSISFAHAAPNNAIELSTAEVKQGFLWLSVRASGPSTAPGPPGPANLPPLLSQLQVAWAVDTRRPSAAVS